MKRLFVLLLVSACVTPSGKVREGTPDAVNLAKARKSGRSRAFDWLPWSKPSFALAKAQRKFVLVDCAAEWCHWCHVMDETTYADERVGQLIRAKVVPIRVDIDERPDLAERYGEWGWPATIVLTPDGEELGKYRGYLTPERMRDLLETLDAQKPMEPVKEPAGIALNELPKAVDHAKERLDYFWDAAEGSWGLRKKVPIGMNIVWELTAGSGARADFTLKKQRVLIDPVWGGIYQYSAAENWSEPHYEKLVTYQAPNLEAYALAYAKTKNPQHLADARLLHRYLSTQLKSPDGTFWTNQDADVNAHEKDKPFIDGEVYYRLNAADRVELGIPWIDTHVYARENGLVIQALVAMFLASGDGAALMDAKRAADVLAETHVLAGGTVKHEAKTPAAGPYYLADAASLGLAYARLGKAAGDAHYKKLAEKIARHMVELFADDSSGALFDLTADPDAVGVFALRPHSFSPNVAAARLLAAVGELERGRKVLAAISATERLDAEGPWVGEYLLAARELGLSL